MDKRKNKIGSDQEKTIDIIHNLEPTLILTFLSSVKTVGFFKGYRPTYSLGKFKNTLEMKVKQRSSSSANLHDAGVYCSISHE